jgi:hypothetical protein
MQDMQSQYVFYQKETIQRCFFFLSRLDRVVTFQGMKTSYPAVSWEPGTQILEDAKRF